MNVSLRWLQALAPDVDLDPDAVSHRLAARGAPVEGVVALAEGLGDVVVARVEAVDPHPDADRLTVCRIVAGGDGGSRRVVCGAPNVRAGGLYPYAPVGATLPNGMAIRRVEIRGQPSEGMLCSARELGLGADHSGLLDLPDGLEPGAPLVEALDLRDWRLDVEITANRGDMLSHLGIAREVATDGVRSVTPTAVPGGTEPTFARVVGAREASAGGATVRIEDPDLCRRYLGAVIRGVEVGPSPPWLQARLRAAGARPINNVVDATNYVLLE
ncbi:MAG: phenylalanine--tRNA ligase beta subunit-related protein, partial [Gemmatimonadota bacterium]